jgi:DNA-binding NtrC family response regulator
LPELVRKGLFREDLYYRLNVVSLNVPPLRKRDDDIREIVEMMMPVICNNLNISIKHLSEEALDKMAAYKWPGNIRELINVLEQLAATVTSMTILPKDLPVGMFSLKEEAGFEVGDQDFPDEEQKLQSALQETHGNKALAAKLLGIHRSTLYEKLKKYAISK